MFVFFGFSIFVVLHVFSVGRCEQLVTTSTVSCLKTKALPGNDLPEIIRLCFSVRSWTTLQPYIVKISSILAQFSHKFCLFFHFSMHISGGGEYYLHLRPSTFLNLGSGMDCLKTLFWRRQFQVSGADLNPFSSSSHILILSSNCTFDTIVVLVVMFKNHWTELNWTEKYSY